MPNFTILLTYLVGTNIGGGSDVLDRSYVYTGAFVFLPCWAIPFIVSSLTTIIATLAGFGGGGGSTGTGNMPPHCCNCYIAIPGRLLYDDNYTCYTLGVFPYIACALFGLDASVSCTLSCDFASL